MSKICSLSYFQPILVAIFATIATVKVESIPDFYTWAIVLMREISEKHILLFGILRGH